MHNLCCDNFNNVKHKIFKNKLHEISNCSNEQFRWLARESASRYVRYVISLESLLNSCAPYCFNWMVGFTGVLFVCCWFLFACFLKRIKDLSLPSQGLTTRYVSRSKLRNFCLQVDKIHILIVCLAIMIALSKLFEVNSGFTHLYNFICVWHATSCRDQAY